MPTFALRVRESVETGKLFDREMHNLVRAKSRELNETNLVRLARLRPGPEHQGHREHEDACGSSGGECEEGTRKPSRHASSSFVRKSTIRP